MKRVRSTAAIALFAAGALLAACHGSPTYVPATQQFTSPQSLAPIPMPKEMAQRLGLPPNASIPACTAPKVGIPGKYTFIIATGNVSGSTFKSVSSTSFWVYAKYVKATPPPTPSPTPSVSPTASPTIGPTPKPIYVYYYYGTFGLKRGVGGCAYLITTKSGKPFVGKDNAETIGLPNLKMTTYYKTTLIAEGHPVMKIGSLSKSGGSGAFTLKTLSGSTYNTGTVHLAGRVLIQL